MTNFHYNRPPKTMHKKICSFRTVASFHHIFVVVFMCLNFAVFCCPSHCLSFRLLSIVLSLIFRFLASDYIFGNFKLFNYVSSKHWYTHNLRPILAYILQPEKLPPFFQTVLYSNADINQYFHIHTRVEENNNWVSLTFFILSTCWYHTHLYVIKSNKQTLLLFWLQRPFFKCLDTLKFFVFKYYVIS